MSGNPSAEPARFLLGVVRPEYRARIQQVAGSIVQGVLIPSSRIDSDGDFAEQLGEASVYFETLGIVATPGCWQPGADNFLMHREASGFCTSPAPVPKSDAMQSARTLDKALVSWGVLATGAHGSSPTTLLADSHIHVAVLDSGVDIRHEAFGSTRVESRSFVDADATRDDQGHGTVCAGVVCGAPVAATAMRYSVAPGIKLFNAKIFDDTGWSPDFRTLAAIDWALRKQCQIISLSLGGRVTPTRQQSRVFDFAARAAMFDLDALLVAGVGNDSMRPTMTRPVTHPANCDHILGVGAIDIEREIWSRSNGGVGVNVDAVDLVAPGVAIFAPVAGTRDQYSVDNFGTSYAAPFAAGIAALWAASDSRLRGLALWRRLERSAETLSFPVSDRGAGLVQAP